MESSLSQKKISELINSLRKMYGTQEKPCSYNHLARIIDPVSPPVNAVVEWARGERGLYGKYKARIAQLVNKSVPELELFLSDADETSNPISLSDKDLKKCQKVVLRITSGQRVQKATIKKSTQVIENLNIEKLSQLYRELDDKLEDLIFVQGDKKIESIYHLHRAVTWQIINKLSMLAEAEVKI